MRYRINKLKVFCFFFFFTFFCDLQTHSMRFNCAKMTLSKYCVLDDLDYAKNAQFCNSTDSFCIIYPQACSFFLETYKKNYYFWNNLLKNKVGLNLVFLISIVSPEISVYNVVGDKFETFGLEAMYVELGSIYGDFSIGLFQMKPTFVELIEKSIAENEKLLNKYSKILIQENTIRKIREIRVSRLKNKVWQFEYLCAFYDIMEFQFSKKITSLREKLNFYAAAYNIGFNKSEREIRRIQQKPIFPSSILYKHKKFIYTEIVEFFYDQILLLKF